MIRSLRPPNNACNASRKLLSPYKLSAEFLKQLQEGAEAPQAGQLRGRRRRKVTYDSFVQVNLRLKNINPRHLFFLVDTLSAPLIHGICVLTDIKGYVDYDAVLPTVEFRRHAHLDSRSPAPSVSDRNILINLEANPARPRPLVRAIPSAITQFDCSVFTGEYVTGGVDAAYLAGLEQQRSDNAKLKAERSGAGPAMVSVKGKNTSDQVLASQPLHDVSGGGEVAGGEDVSQVVGLSNASDGHVQEKPSMIVGLGNEGM
ncbi:hypothetical protein JCM5296_000675 [Sporobolomyces johnsonii]